MSGITVLSPKDVDHYDGQSIVDGDVESCTGGRWAEGLKA